jgi:hypothetical protein
VEAVRPCLIALSEERCLPVSVIAPRDFAPLARADSDLIRKSIWVTSVHQGSLAMDEFSRAAGARNCGGMRSGRTKSVTGEGQ